jgi:hypothetical protein
MRIYFKSAIWQNDFVKWQIFEVEWFWEIKLKEKKKGEVKR